MELHVKVILALCLIQAIVNVAGFYEIIMRHRKELDELRPEPLPDFCTSCHKEVSDTDLRNTFHAHCFESYSNIREGWQNDSTDT